MELLSAAREWEPGKELEHPLHFRYSQGDLQFVTHRIFLTYCSVPFCISLTLKPTYRFYNASVTIKS